MNLDAKLEKKIVRDLAKFLAGEPESVKRWRRIGNAWIVAGSLLCVLALFICAQDTSVPWMLATLSVLGGFCLGLGLWFTTFVEQWPVVRPFIDAERVRQRSVELGVQAQD
jgi:hypothetical protein